MIMASQPPIHDAKVVIITLLADTSPNIFIPVPHFIPQSDRIVYKYSDSPLAATPPKATLALCGASGQ